MTDGGILQEAEEEARDSEVEQAELPESAKEAMAELGIDREVDEERIDEQIEHVRDQLEHGKDIDEIELPGGLEDVDREELLENIPESTHVRAETRLDLEALEEAKEEYSQPENLDNVLDLEEELEEGMEVVHDERFKRAPLTPEEAQEQYADPDVDMDEQMLDKKIEFAMRTNPPVEEVEDPSEEPFAVRLGEGDLEEKTDGMLKREGGELVVEAHDGEMEIIADKDAFHDDLTVKGNDNAIRVYGEGADDVDISGSGNEVEFVGGLPEAGEVTVGQRNTVTVGDNIDAERMVVHQQSRVDVDGSISGEELFSRGNIHARQFEGLESATFADGSVTAEEMTDMQTMFAHGHTHVDVDRIHGVKQDIIFHGATASVSEITDSGTVYGVGAELNVDRLETDSMDIVGTDITTDELNVRTVESRAAVEYASPGKPPEFQLEFDTYDDGRYGGNYARMPNGHGQIEVTGDADINSLDMAASSEMIVDGDVTLGQHSNNSETNIENHASMTVGGNVNSTDSDIRVKGMSEFTAEGDVVADRFETRWEADADVGGVVSAREVTVSGSHGTRDSARDKASLTAEHIDAEGVHVAGSEKTQGEPFASADLNATTISADKMNVENGKVIGDTIDITGDKPVQVEIEGRHTEVSAHNVDVAGGTIRAGREADFNARHVELGQDGIAEVTGETLLGEVAGGEKSSLFLDTTPSSSGFGAYIGEVSGETYVAIESGGNVEGNDQTVKIEEFTGNNLVHVKSPPENSRHDMATVELGEMPEGSTRIGEGGVLHEMPADADGEFLVTDESTANVDWAVTDDDVDGRLMLGKAGNDHLDEEYLRGLDAWGVSETRPSPDEM